MYSIHLLEEGSQGAGVWFVLAVLVVFAVMVLLGWLAVTRGWLKKEAEPKPVEHEAQASAKAVVDDLTTLEGIGPKVASVLAGIGIANFESLAKADFDTVRTALDAAGYKYMDPAGWIEQAALAAKGDLDGLKKLQDSLKGGRKVS
jgi:hypothetical protein